MSKTKCSISNISDRGKVEKVENAPIRKPGIGSLQNVLMLLVRFVVVHEI